MTLPTPSGSTLCISGRVFATDFQSMDNSGTAKRCRVPAPREGFTMKTRRQEEILTVAELVHDSQAMSEAALARDFDEARFRAMLVSYKAHEMGLERVAAASQRVLDRLGPIGSLPQSRYGQAILRVANELDVIWFD